MKIQYLAKSLFKELQDIIYINDFQDHYKYFSPSCNTKFFLLPYFQHIPISHKNFNKTNPIFK